MKIKVYEAIKQCC